MRQRPGHRSERKQTGTVGRGRGVEVCGGSLGAWELGVWEGGREEWRHRLGKPPKELGNFTQGTRRTSGLDAPT